MPTYSYALIWTFAPTATLPERLLKEWPKFYGSDDLAMKGATARFKNSKPVPGDHLMVLRGEPGDDLRLIGTIALDDGDVRSHARPGQNVVYITREPLPARVA